MFNTLGMSRRSILPSKYVYESPTPESRSGHAVESSPPIRVKPRSSMVGIGGLSVSVVAPSSTSFRSASPSIITAYVSDNGSGSGVVGRGGSRRVRGRGGSSWRRVELEADRRCSGVRWERDEVD